MSKPSDERYTPQWLLDLVRAFCPITYDPCAPAHNPVRAESFTCLPESGLLTNWRMRAPRGLVWVNPPFSELKPWVEKVRAESVRGTHIAMLTPVDPSTQWFRDLYSLANVASFLRKRLKYDLPGGAYDTSAKQPAMLWYFGHRRWAFQAALYGHAISHFPTQGSWQ